MGDAQFILSKMFVRVVMQTICAPRAAETIEAGESRIGWRPVDLTIIFAHVRRGRNVFGLATLISSHGWRRVLLLVTPLFDRIIGLHSLSNLYGRNHLGDLDSESFASGAIAALQMRFSWRPEQLSRIPESGQAIVVSNHPFGGAEGLILCSLLGRVRPDFKIVVNHLLGTISPMTPNVILTNPINAWSQHNLGAYRACSRWVEDGHLLVMFPVGRVASYKRSVGSISDGR